VRRVLAHGIAEPVPIGRSRDGAPIYDPNERHAYLMAKLDDQVARGVFGNVSRTRVAEVVAPDRGDFLERLTAATQGPPVIYDRTDIDPRPTPAPSHEQMIASEVQRIEVRDAAKRIVDARTNPPKPIRIHSLTDLQHTPEIQWWIQGIIPKSSVVVMAGDGGVGKSAVLIDMAAHLNTGTPFLRDFATNQARVLYVAGEGYAGYGPRLKAVQAAHMAMSDERFALASEGVKLSNEQSVATLAQMVARDSIDVVVLDTLSTLATLESENDAAEVARIMQACQSIANARAGCTVILVHHTNKASGTIRGSSVIRDNADVLWMLRGESEGFIMSNKTTAGGKMKDGTPLEIKGLALRPAHGSVIVERLDIVPETPGERRTAAVLQLMEPGREYSTPDLDALVSACDLTASDSTRKRAVTDMVNAGKIERIGRGMYRLIA
jgi:archaellum biogenesis ATPase FlaH